MDHFLSFNILFFAMCTTQCINLEQGKFARNSFLGLILRFLELYKTARKTVTLFWTMFHFSCNPWGCNKFVSDTSSLCTFINVLIACTLILITPNRLLRSKNICNKFVAFKGKTKAIHSAKTFVHMKSCNCKQHHKILHSHFSNETHNYTT